MKGKKIVKRVLDNFESYICQFLLSFFIILLFVQIILREVFSLNISWGEELARFSFVWFVFFGASFAARLAAHNRVTFQFRLFPKIVGDVSMLISDLIWIAFNCTIVYYSINVIKEGFLYPEYSPTLDWIMAYIFMIFPIAFTLMTVRIIQVNIMKHILKIDIADVDKVDTGEDGSEGPEGEVAS